MIIEFVGLPGSGKTYLTNLLCKDGKFIISEQPDITYLYRIKCILRIFKSRILIFYLFKIFISFNNINLKLKRFKSLIFLSDYKNQTNKMIVYDQHLIQNLVALQNVLKCRLGKKELSSIIKVFKLPINNTIFVYNNVQIDVVLSRFNNRRNSDIHNKTLLDFFDGKELLNELSKLQEITTETLTHLNDLQFKIIELNSKFDIEQLKDNLYNFVAVQKNE